MNICFPKGDGKNDWSAERKLVALGPGEVYEPEISYAGLWYNSPVWTKAYTIILSLTVYMFPTWQDLYQKFLDGDETVADIPREEDPFWEPPEDLLVGTANVFLQSLAYALDFDDKLSVTDYKVYAWFNWVS